METVFEEAQDAEMGTESGGAGGEGEAGVPHSTCDVDVK